MKTKLVIFGLSGDLGRRKLLPALANIVAQNAIPDLEVIGISRRAVDVDDLFREAKIDNAKSRKLREIATMHQMDLAKSADYDQLKTFLGDDSDTQILLYLSVPPAAATSIVDNLGRAGINNSRVKIMFEKPFGFDLTSAHDMIDRTARYFAESQIYRVDHYLEKEMAQNLIAMRYGNALFSHIWNNRAIESIDVIASAEIGIEGRSAFYEQTGALRDFLQGHSMQLLALMLAKIPANFVWSDLPKIRLEALRRLDIAKPENAFRAQYRGYREEVANSKSMTETAAGVKLFSHDPDFANVPLRLVTGKRLARKSTEIRVNLRREHAKQENTIMFRIQPDEGVEMRLFAKKPGLASDTREFVAEKFGFNFPLDTKFADAYEQIFVDAARAYESFFASSDEIIRQWEILDPVQRFWSLDRAPLEIYEPGTSIEDLLRKLR